MESAAARNRERILYMLGAATLRDLNTFLDQGSVDTPERKDSIRAGWRTAAEHFQRVQLSGDRPELIETSALPAPMLPVAEAARQTATFGNTFCNFPFTFEMAEVDRLVATQRRVNLDHADRIVPPPEGDELWLARLCLDPHDRPPAVRCARTASGYALASDHPGLSLLGLVDADPGAAAAAAWGVGGQLARAVIAMIGFPVATMSAIRVGRRLILSNGFHRAYRLRSLGVTMVPLLVMHSQYPELELPEMLADSQVRYLTSAERPPLVKDFFDEAMVCEIVGPARTKSVQLTLQVTESQVPKT
jgi:hypothetical protein